MSGSLSACKQLKNLRERSFEHEEACFTFHLDTVLRVLNGLTFASRCINILTILSMVLMWPLLAVLVSAFL